LTSLLAACPQTETSINNKLNRARQMREKFWWQGTKVASRITSRREQIWMAMCKERSDPLALKGITSHLYFQRSEIHMRGNSNFQQLSSLASAYATPVAISIFSAALASSRRLVSYSFNSPMGSTFCTPFSPNTTLEVKYGKSVMSDFT